MSLGLNDTDSLITWVKCSSNVHCVGYVSCTVAVEPWLLLGDSWAVWPSGWLTIRTDPDPSVQAAVWSMSPRAEIYPNWVQFLLGSLFFGLLFVELIGYGMKLFTRSFCFGSTLLAGNLVQINMKHCLSPALDYLLGATKWYIVYGCLFQA